MKKYEVYETNAGNLILIAYNEKGHADYIHTGYEFVPGQLKQDLQALADGDDPATDWDGNEIDDYIADEIAQAESGEWGELVADNDGIYLDHAGCAATDELGQEEELRMKKFSESGTIYRCYPCTAISSADNGNETMRQDAVLVISTGDAEQIVEVVFGYDLPQEQADFLEMCGDSAAWESDQETLRSVRCRELGSGLEPWKAHVWY